MSAELKKRPRPPINYQRKIHIPKGADRQSLEVLAWWFWDLGFELPKSGTLAIKGRCTRTVSAIQRQIIEQYGWPERE